MIPAARTAIDAPSDRSLRVPCFCEENIWRLAYRHLYGGSSSSITNNTSSSSSSSCWYVVFVSNPTGCVPMMQQLAAATCSGLNDRQKNQPVFWDYHVILVERRRRRTEATAPNNNSTAETTTEEQRTSSTTTTIPSSLSSSSSYVWDIDSLLPCPCPIEEYLEASFSNHTNWPSKYRPFFRVVDAELYIQHFSSDRSHMINQQTGEWSAPPPTYDCIISNLAGGNRQTESNMTKPNCDGNEDDDDDGNSCASTKRSYGTMNNKKHHDGKKNGKGGYTMKRYMTMIQVDVDRDMMSTSTSTVDDVDKKIQDVHLEPFGKIFSMPQFQHMFGCECE
mmetsp:Transcript_54297/g.131736  ORF Transcript_54297/g.131736 Transcript_54297/m.131736 type:complete len:335 (-) Transcript_54297:43-1047(-)